MEDAPQPHIGSLNEQPLHAALKAWYARPGDRMEADVDGYIIDIVRDDLLIEIQTTSFGKLSRKLCDLLARHRVRLVYPVAQEKWIVRLADDEQTRLGRRKSPVRGTFAHLFGQLVSFPGLLADPNLALDVLLIQEEELRRHEPGRAWRRKGWVTHQRHLLEVVDRRLFRGPADLLSLLPPDLPVRFTTADLAKGMGQRRRLAQQAAYCLREVGAIAQVGKQGNALLYELAQADPGLDPA
jgi:hypothetical protein